jgi:hypothetical protein
MDAAIHWAGTYYPPRMAKMQPNPRDFEKWLADAKSEAKSQGDFEPMIAYMRLAELAYAAGADEQLRSCVQWLCDNGWAKAADEMDSAMRPKPLSLKQQALEAFHRRRAERKYFIREGMEIEIAPDLYADMDLMERALKSLPDD